MLRGTDGVSSAEISVLAKINMEDVIIVFTLAAHILEYAIIMSVTHG